MQDRDKELIEALNAHTEAMKQLDWRLDRISDSIDSMCQSLDNNANAVTQAERNRRDYR